MRWALPRQGRTWCGSQAGNITSRPASGRLRVTPSGLAPRAIELCNLGYTEECSKLRLGRVLINRPYPVQDRFGPEIRHLRGTKAYPLWALADIDRGSELAITRSIPKRAAFTANTPCQR